MRVAIVLALLSTGCPQSVDNTPATKECACMCEMATEPRARVHETNENVKRLLERFKVTPYGSTNPDQ